MEVSTVALFSLLTVVAAIPPDCADLYDLSFILEDFRFQLANWDYFYKDRDGNPVYNWEWVSVKRSA